MKILYTWNKTPLNDEFKPYLDRMYEVYPDAEKVCITDQRLDYEATVIDRATFIQKISDKTKIPYDYVNVMRDVRFKEFCHWVYLSENPYTLCMDIDIYMKTHIPESDEIGVWHWDECSMWSGAHPEHFKKAFEKRKNDIMLVRCVSKLPETWDLSEYMEHKKISLIKERG